MVYLAVFSVKITLIFCHFPLKKEDRDSLCSWW